MVSTASSSSDSANTTTSPASMTDWVSKYASSSSSCDAKCQWDQARWDHDTADEQWQQAHKRYVQTTQGKDAWNHLFQKECQAKANHWKSQMNTQFHQKLKSIQQKAADSHALTRSNDLLRVYLQKLKKDTDTQKADWDRKKHQVFTNERKSEYAVQSIEQTRFVYSSIVYVFYFVAWLVYVWVVWSSSSSYSISSIGKKILFPLFFLFLPYFLAKGGDWLFQVAWPRFQPFLYTNFAWHALQPATPIQSE